MNSRVTNDNILVEEWENIVNIHICEYLHKILAFVFANVKKDTLGLHKNEWEILQKVCERVFHSWWHVFYFP